MNEELVRAAAHKIWHIPMASDYSQVKAVLEAIEQAGYAVVPREPTVTMKKAGTHEIYQMNIQDDGPSMVAKSVYKAMLAAAEQDDG